MDIIQGKFFKLNYTCVTIGKFDGVHIGHRQIISKLIEVSKEFSYRSAVLTFDFDYFKSENEKRLNTREEKKALLQKCGIDILVDYPFDGETKNMTPEEFSKEVLVGKLDAKAVVVGDNFRFGKDAAGDVSALKEFGNKYGFKVYSIPLVEFEGSMVSSTRIREELNAGHKKKVKAMLTGIN